LSRQSVLYRGQYADMARNKWSVGSDGTGPSWSDVSLVLAELRDFSGCKCELLIESSSSVRGAWGLRVSVRMHGSGRTYGAVGYGRAYPDGPATMAGAVYASLLKATAEYEQVLLCADDDVPF